MLAYERFGSGEPLVLVHGIAHRRQAWYPVAERLAEHREVVLFDLPGHGESPALDLAGRTVQEALQQHLEDLFRELGLVRPHIAGNSLGGRIALEAAASGIVSSATGLAPAGFWRDDKDFQLIRAHFAALIAAGRVAAPLAPTLTRSGIGRRLMLASLMTHGERLSADRVLGDLRNMVEARKTLRDIIGGAFSFEAEIAADVPVTVAWGTRDRVLLPYQGRRARRLLPQAEHVWLPGSGHVPMSDDADAVVEIILRGSSGGLLAVDDAA
ncbi:alpha/beta fold hydrolase [Tsukamurella paurometabola]|uniref:Alpha/beta fold hydrolase n=1 Tax=Tsukamurella paurometabola TaxID=2061 RepID=A0ABS5NB23_TSUPA|nr:alpha/beta fold hydrolase [Tsukamurella paurometabola]MBS4101491.1 alpha/beta fold hydrolase [Tsukamurella paurometabola]